MAKRFRKVYIVCEDNKIFGHTSTITAYQTRDQAERMCERERKKAIEEASKNVECK
jgi:hypothetical protein